VTVRDLNEFRESRELLGQPPQDMSSARKNALTKKKGRKSEGEEKTKKKKRGKGQEDCMRLSHTKQRQQKKGRGLVDLGPKTTKSGNRKLRTAEKGKIRTRKNQSRLNGQGDLERKK